MSEPRRPLSLTLTAVGIFLFAIWNFWRAWIVAQQRSLLKQLGATLDPDLRLALAVVWGIVFLVLALGLWQRRAGVRKGLPLALLLYGALHLLLLFLFTPAAARRGWPVQLLLTVAAGGWTAWVCLRRAHREQWRAVERQAGLNFTQSPFTLRVVQRGYDGEPKD